MANKRVCVTGGTGFLGRAIVDELAQRGIAATVPSRRTGFDLRTAGGAQAAMQGAEVVIHAAASISGISYNRRYPASILHDNGLINLHVLAAAHQAGVEKLVLIGSACAYPDQAAQPYQEADLLAGPMHPSVAQYGLTKRMLHLGAQAYRDQHGLHSIELVLANLYGPHDHFGEEGHVLGSLIARFVEAAVRGEHEVVCWGTGTTRREFLNVRDAARLIVDAAEHYDSPEPLNIGSGQEVSIAWLAEVIARAVRFHGTVRWDQSVPEGAPRKVLDVERLLASLDIGALTPIAQGIDETVAWYRAQRLEVG